MKKIPQKIISGVSCLLLVAGMLTGGTAMALDNPQSGSVGLEGTISSAPPTKAPTITTPGSGATFTSTPISVNGICTTDLLVKVFSNNVFVGSVLCVNGSYSVSVDLFSGHNDIVVRAYDALDQASPDSNVIGVQFNDAQTAQFGTRVSITSPYARRGANPGDELTWPILVSGGNGPYALSVDWGDGKSADLQSVPFAGPVQLKHSYVNAGVYNVIIKATDANGTSAYLQVVGVANGAVQSNTAGTKNGPSSSVTLRIMWWPMLLLMPLIMTAFWLGRRHELYALRKQMEESAAAAEDDEA